jgi:hypothetical protein
MQTAGPGSGHPFVTGGAAAITARVCRLPGWLMAEEIASLAKLIFIARFVTYSMNSAHLAAAATSAVSLSRRCHIDDVQADALMMGLPVNCPELQRTITSLARLLLRRACCAQILPTTLSHHQKRTTPTDSRRRIDVIPSDTKDSLQPTSYSRRNSGTGRK